MKILFSIFSLLFTFQAFGQYDINIKVKNFDNDTIIIGNYYADKQLVKDTIVAKKKGKFTFTGKDTLPEGVYFVLTLPEKDFIQFFVNNEDTEFDIEWNVKADDGLKIKGSKDNELFLDYIQFLAEKRPEADRYRARITAADTLGKKDEEAEKLLKKVDEEVVDKQRAIVSGHPNTITSKFIGANLLEDIPEFEGTDQEVQLKSYRWYKKHYFDNIDLGHPANLRSPYQHKRIEYYLEKLTPQDPDSVIISIDYLLKKMEPSPETFKYYLSYFLNKYINVKLVGYDKIYVHLVDKYYSTGKADWISEENLKKLEKQANDFRTVLIGRQFPNITTYKEDGTPVNVYDIESPYTIVMFWAHTCGHCTKAMPKIVEFYDEYENKGVTLLSICTKGGKKTKPCMEAVPEKNMEKFINTFDEYQRYRKSIYIPSTPKIFILDENKKIIIKDIPADKLKEIMPDIMKMKENKKQ